MPALFERILKLLVQKLGTLLVILGILLAAQWVSDEWEEWEQAYSDIRTNESLLAGRRSELARIEADIARHQAAWNAQREIARRRLEGELDQIDARLARAEKTWRDPIAKFARIQQQATAARRAADNARRKRDALVKESAWWDWFLRRDKVAELEMAKATYVALDKVADAWEAASDKVASTLAKSPIATLKAERSRKTKELADALTAVSPDVQALLDPRDKAQQDIARAEDLLRGQRERIAQDPTQRLLEAARAKLPMALWILVGVILAPILMKVVFYFVLAPLAERLPPIRIIPNHRAPEVPPPAPSEVSIPFEVRPNEELLVQSDFVQSSSQPARKATQWFLNPRIPFSSIASGMFALTRVRSEGDGTTRVVVSSQTDPLGEIGVIEIPRGAAMIVQPRSLAGLVKQVGVPIEITRHWRLSSLHAWLTLQLRYLAFHGPCSLILKGCRGVRAERPEPGQPRLINQASTLGFSANLDYKNTRCETFVSYFRGKEDLFNDLFAGGPGWFVYEEMPAARRRTGITGRGLEGVVDTFLKAFGI
jgi:uncharacterized protein (AIM24 family)